jgi:hypothetical protein
LVGLPGKIAYLELIIFIFYVQGIAVSEFFHILDFCDIPELMTHLQENHRYWKENSEEETS